MSVMPAGRERGGRHLAVVCTIAVGAMLLGHFAAKPGMDWVLDDWSNLRDAFGKPRWIHASRQISILFNVFGFRIFGHTPEGVCFVSMLANVACLLLLMASVWRLTRSIAGTFAAGLVLATAPNIYEHTQWPTMIISSTVCALLPYFASMAAWIRFAQNRQKGFLILSAFCYAFAVATYEVGIFMPLAYPWAARGFKRRDWMLSVGVFGAFLFPVLLWRLTGALGLATFGMAPQFTPATDPTVLFWNAKQSLSWFAGPAAAQTLWRGLSGLRMASGTFVVVSVLALVIGLVIATVVSVRRYNNWCTGWGCGRATGFGITLVIAGLLPSIPSYACSRLMYVPIAGLAVVVGAFVGRWDPRASLPVLGAWAVLGMLSNQGTSLQWSEAGVFGRRLFDYLNDPVIQRQWEKKDILYFNTDGLPRHCSLDLVPAYGNAELIRGFVPFTMIPPRKSDGDPVPSIVLDFECGAVLEEDALKWHDRYMPDRPHETPLDRVYVVDCGEFWSRP